MLFGSSVTSQNPSLEVRHEAALTDSEAGIKVPFQSDKFNFTLIWESSRATLSSYIRIQAQPSLSMTALREVGVGLWGGEEGHVEEKEKKKISYDMPQTCANNKNLLCVSAYDVSFLPQIQTRLPMSGWVTVHYSEDALAGVACAACTWQGCRGGGLRREGRTLASASLLNCLAVCSWLEWISAQRGAPRPCQERWLFSNAVWQAEESRAGVTHMLLSRGKALVGVSATATPRLSVLISKANSFPKAPACKPHGAQREKKYNPLKHPREGWVTGGSAVLDSYSAHTESSPLSNL